jgi:hypothetical protein
MFKGVQAGNYFYLIGSDNGRRAYVIRSRRGRGTHKARWVRDETWRIPRFPSFEKACAAVEDWARRPAQRAPAPGPDDYAI